MNDDLIDDRAMRAVFATIAERSVVPELDRRQLHRSLNRRHRRYGIYAATTIVVGLCLSAVAFNELESDSHRDSAGRGPQLSTPTEVKSTAHAVDHFTKPEMAALRELDISIGGPGDPQGANVSRGDAIRAALRDLGRKTRPRHFKAVLAVVTTNAYGAQAQQDPSRPSGVKPQIDHALTWVIAIASTPEQEVSGDPDFQGNPPSGAGRQVHVFVFVAARGAPEVLYGASA